MMNKPIGVQSSLITPFDVSGAIKEEAFRKHISWQIESGVHGIGVCPNTGEFVNLEFSDIKKIVDIAVSEAAGRVPVTVGALSPSMRYNLAIIEYAKKAGASFVLVQAPYYLPPSKDMLFSYFKELGSVGIPMIIFNHPYKTPYNLTVDVLENLCKIETFVSVKEVDMNMGNNVTRLEFLHSCNRTYLQGEEYMALYHYIHGGDGAFPALGNIEPKLCVDLYNACKSGDLSLALKLHMDMLKLGQVVYVENYPAGIKEAMNLLGRDGGVTRKPLGTITHEHMEQLKAVLKEINLME